MAKNDFDIDFDFEKEYGFDPNAILSSDTEEDLDLNQFTDEELGLSPAPQEEPQEEDVPAPQEEENPDLEEEELELEDEEEPEEDFGDEAFDEDADDELLDVTRRANFFGSAEGEEIPLPVYETPDEKPAGEETPELPAYEGEDEDEEDDDMDDEDYDDEDPTPRKRERKKREPIQFTVPPFLIKLYKLYFPSMEEIDPKPQPGSGRRRKSKIQVFKEAYLPAILACVALVLVFGFAVGSLTNFFDLKKKESAAAKLESQVQANAEAEAAKKAQQTIEEAQVLAAGYDYQGAIDLIDAFEGSATNSQMIALKAEYTSAKDKLVAHKDMSTVPNLSFHVLIEDLSRALADTDDLRGSYNKNFVTTQEFSKILDQLYKNNYVLVDMDSFVAENTGTDGKASFFPDTVYLPEGKKPVMITETMVNYFSYMNDGDKDGNADAKGDGFASRLLIDDFGEIKAEYVDGNGQTKVGDYDLVPILETFIKAHPDFSYRGARATLAVCGMEGVFGYRVNNTYVPTRGQSYVDEQIALAKDLVAALRSKGYRIACYSYDNISYGEKNAQQIQADMNLWAAQIFPVLGQVDTLVYARESDIGDYSGAKFTVLYDAGIRYFIKNGETPYAEINNTYVRQTRLMVTGRNMQHKASMFTTLGLFDPITVLDPSRGNVPN